MILKLRSKMKKTNNQKGFTLVELMVVVVIIGILAAIAVPVYSSISTKAETNACLANIRTLEGAYLMYTVENNGTAPADVPALGAFVKDVPTCPTDGEPYTLGTTAGTIECPNNHHVITP